MPDLLSGRSPNSTGDLHRLQSRVGQFRQLTGSTRTILITLNILQERKFLILRIYSKIFCGPSSSVSIATGYWLDGPGIESRWKRIFHTRPDRPWAHPASYFNVYREVLSPGQSCRSWNFTTKLLPLAKSRTNGRAPPVPPYSLHSMKWDSVYRLKYVARWKSKWNPLPSLRTVLFRRIQRDAVSELNWAELNE